MTAYPRISRRLRQRYEEPAEQDSEALARGVPASRPQPPGGLVLGFRAADPPPSTAARLPDPALDERRDDLSAARGIALAVALGALLWLTAAVVVSRWLQP